MQHTKPSLLGCLERVGVSLIFGILVFGTASAQDTNQIRELLKGTYKLTDRTFNVLGDLGLDYTQDPGGSEKPPVGLTEFKCLTDDFKDRIQKRTVGPDSPITVPSGLRLTRSSLESHLVSDNQCKVVDDEQRGIVVHFGLDDNLEFAIALEFVCLLANPDAGGSQLENVGTAYPLVGSSLGSALSLKDWYYDTDGPGRRYAEKVVIDRYGDGQFEPFEMGRDVQSVTFPYEAEIKLLIDQTDITSNEYLELVPIASPGAWKQLGTTDFLLYDFGQGVAWKEHGAALTNAHDPSKPFEDKAAELGSPCPPNCPIIKFKEFGVLKRPITCP